jgi:hypothetical protein
VIDERENGNPLAMSEQPSCCGEPLHWLIAEARASDNLAFQLYRCAWCEQFTKHLQHPWGMSRPSGSAVAKQMHKLHRRFEAEIANAYA